jgi:hypothetical protein
MEQTEAQKCYPKLMAYILDRSENYQTSAKWCEQLRADEKAALNGELAEVASELAQAHADYAAQVPAGSSTYPYNSAIGKFLGLPVRSNDEPPHGYYMASCVMHSWRLGEASRKVRRLLEAGAVLQIPLARDRKTNKPIRVARYLAHMVELQGSDVVCRDDKRQFRLSSNWSVESCMEKVVRALETGEPYAA